MTAVLQKRDYTGKAVLYMGMESSGTNWKLGFSNDARDRVETIGANDREALLKSTPFG
uniref:Uncharacterized protein n=1 Tax=Candidatus Kentrum sp. FW TaxID=2126338 RepID=A0A450U0S5_9GAMM|nr:MAG: hypothetical protein BECKFW1821C_GA0114237_10938 [Candidatus Kentron sp. FW]